MLTFDEWKALFDKADKQVMVDWDGGHAYHYLEGTPSPEDCDDPDLATEYEYEYMSNQGPTLYCAPSVINEIVGSHVCVSDGCYDRLKTITEQIDHLEGFIELANSMNEGAWYHTKELSEHVDKLKLMNLVDKLT